MVRVRGGGLVRHVGASMPGGRRCGTSAGTCSSSGGSSSRRHPAPPPADTGGLLEEIAFVTIVTAAITSSFVERARQRRIADSETVEAVVLST